MSAHEPFDIVFVGNYTHDTIVYPDTTRIVDGGAFYYGAHVAVRSGQRVAVVTHLARPHWHVVDYLKSLGITVFATPTPASTCLRLIYPTANLDQRTIEVISTAGSIEPEEVAGIEARAWHVCASLRGEVPLSVVEALAARQVPVSLDVQGYVRVAANGTLIDDNWPGKEAFLRHITVLKTDAVEARALTGEADRHLAAQKLAAYGPREILLTHGGGVMVHVDGARHEAPFVPDQLRGRSGRGDTCTAAYLSRRLSAPPEDAVIWAAALTSLKLEAEGPFSRDMAEVEALYQRLRQSQKRSELPARA